MLLHPVFQHADEVGDERILAAELIRVSLTGRTKEVDGSDEIGEEGHADGLRQGNATELRENEGLDDVRGHHNRQAQMILLQRCLRMQVQLPADTRA